MKALIPCNLSTRVASIALQAGEAIREVASSLEKVDIKSDGSPVTRADLASNKIICEGLIDLIPGTHIISEESWEAEKEESSLASDGYWCVDPLDGTKEFIGGRGDYTVNIALVEHGDPIWGVIYAPDPDILYFATRGAGAWKITDTLKVFSTENAKLPLEQPIRLPSEKRPGNAPPVAVISRSHPSKDTDAFLEKHLISSILRRGSSLKLCAVAEGSADVYPRFGPTCLWDTAAGTAIAREAGCRVTDLGGKPLSYLPQGGIKHPGFLVISERCFHVIDELSGTIRNG